MDDIRKALPAIKNEYFKSKQNIWYTKMTLLEKYLKIYISFHYKAFFLFILTVSKDTTKIGKKADQFRD